MEYEELKRRFPHLARELELSPTLRITSVRSSVEEGEKAARPLDGYTPTVIDFIRRCDTDDQALEIINFLEERGEISGEYAARLRKQLVESGVRSFGKKREPGCYIRGEVG